MTITQDFFRSVIQAVDNNFFCYLMTSDDRLINTIKQLNGTRMYDYYSDISLSTENKNVLISHVLTFNAEKHVSRFEIFKDNHLVFISYNGFEKGLISSIIPLSEDFIDKFVKTKICRVADKMTITQDFFISTLFLFKENNLYCKLQSITPKNIYIILKSKKRTFFFLQHMTVLKLLKSLRKSNCRKILLKNMLKQNYVLFGTR